MGIQAASVGAGMFVETTLSGFLGNYGFIYVNFVHSYWIYFHDLTGTAITGYR